MRSYSCRAYGDSQEVRVPSPLGMSRVFEGAVHRDPIVVRRLGVGTTKAQLVVVFRNGIRSVYVVNTTAELAGVPTLVDLLLGNGTADPTDVDELKIVGGKVEWNGLLRSHVLCAGAGVDA